MNFGNENLIVAVCLTSLLDSMHPGKNEKQTKPFEIHVQTLYKLAWVENKCNTFT